MQLFKTKAQRQKDMEARARKVIREIGKQIKQIEKGNFQFREKALRARALGDTHLFTQIFHKIQFGLHQVNIQQRMALQIETVMQIRDMERSTAAFAKVIHEHASLLTNHSATIDWDRLSADQEKIRLHAENANEQIEQLLENAEQHAYEPEVSAQSTIGQSQVESFIETGKVVLEERELVPMLQEAKQLA